MLEIFGSQYVIDHVVAEHNCRMETTIYRSYMSDVVRAIAGNLGVEVNTRFADLFERPIEQEMTGDEIALQVIKKAGLKGNTDESA